MKKDIDKLFAELREEGHEFALLLLAVEERSKTFAEKLYESDNAGASNAAEAAQTVTDLGARVGEFGRRLKEATK